MKETSTPATSEGESSFRGVDRPSNFTTAESASTANEKAANAESNIRQMLGHYDIGRKLRLLRLKRKIALVDLGKYTGLSASMLSQLENSKLVPTLPTLARIAMVFDVGLEHFFEGHSHQKRFSVVRAGEPGTARREAGSGAEVSVFTAPDQTLVVQLVEFANGDRDDALAGSQNGLKFVHVLDGSIRILYQGEEHLLNPGDSAHFEATEPHSFRAGGPEASRALVIVTEPRI